MRLLLLIMSSVLVWGESCPEGKVGVPPNCGNCNVNKDCNGRGKSVSITNNACLCKCNDMWSGQNCGHCDDKFDQQTCASCNMGRVQYPECIVCDVRTFCSQGAQSTKISSDLNSCKCICRNHWDGQMCDQCLDQHSVQSDCSKCKPGWKPVQPNDICIKCSRKDDCSGRGEPSERSDDCVCNCDEGFRPPDCRQRTSDIPTEIISFRRKLPIIEPVIALAVLQKNGIAVYKSGVSIIDLNSETSDDKVITGTLTFPQEMFINEANSIPVIETRHNLEGRDIAAILSPGKGILFIDVTIPTNVTLLLTVPIQDITCFAWRDENIASLGDSFIDFTWASSEVEKGGFATQRVSLGISPRRYPITNRFATRGSHAVVHSIKTVSERDLIIVNDKRDFLLLEINTGNLISVSALQEAISAYEPRLQLAWVEHAITTRQWIYALTPIAVLGFELEEKTWLLESSSESRRTGSHSLMTVADIKTEGNIIRHDESHPTIIITDSETGIAMLKDVTLTRDDYSEELFNCFSTTSKPGVLEYAALRGPSNRGLVFTCEIHNETSFTQDITVMGENQGIFVHTPLPEQKVDLKTSSSQMSVKLPVIVSCLLCMFLSAVVCIVKLRSDISKRQIKSPLRGSLLEAEHCTEITPINPIGREIPWNEFSNLLLVGEGNSGCVFKALYAVTQETVALKESKKKLDEHFISEINTLCSLVQKDILMLYGWARNDNSLFMITEFCSRGCLDTFVGTNIIGRESIALSMGSTASALAFIHGRKLAHCDVAARNILVNERFSFKLADMGLMTEQDTCITKPIAVAWSPPESLSSVRIATQFHDVWGFGCLLYEILTGKYPFHHIPKQPGSKHNRLSIIRLAIVRGELPKRPTTCSPIAEAIWDNVILKCWSKDPKNRLSMEQIIFNLKTIREEYSIDSLPLLQPITTSSMSSLDTNVYTSGNQYGTGHDATGDELVYSLYTDLDLNVSSENIQSNPQQQELQYDYSDLHDEVCDSETPEYCYSRMQSDTLDNRIVSNPLQGQEVIKSIIPIPELNYQKRVAVPVLQNENRRKSVVPIPQLNLLQEEEEQPEYDYSTLQTVTQQSAEFNQNNCEDSLLSEDIKLVS